MYKKYILIFCIIYLETICCEKNKINSEDLFIPTKEWQVVKEGQSIPKGLHVRINLQTGLKEAKLVDSINEKSSDLQKPEQKYALLQLEQPSPEDVQDNKDINSNVYSSKQLEQVLQNIRSDENPVDRNDLKRVKKNFKDYEQLKKELKDLNISVKSDVQILHDLLINFKEIISDKKLGLDEKDEEILSILKNIEYLVHQIDNANEFIDLNGFNEVIYTNFNNSNIKIKCEILNILGSCVQNNAKAQINALETGAVEKVLRLLALDSNVDVKMRAVYSLSSLLRRFPVAQKEFIQNGGLSIFSKILSESKIMKLQLKIITLMYDLLTEQKEALEDVSNIDYKERAKQYRVVDLKNKLTDSSWCRLFQNTFINNAKAEDHDAIERCLNIMSLITDKCISIFSNERLINLLQYLYDNYKTFSIEESIDNTDVYFTNLKNITYDLLFKLTNLKTEL